MSTLPYPTRADLIERPDTIITADVPCAIWPADARVLPGGVHYDHEGECPPQFADDLKVANRVLRQSGEDYVIVSATHHGYFPHVALRLRRSTGARN